MKTLAHPLALAVLSLLVCEALYAQGWKPVVENIAVGTSKNAAVRVVSGGARTSGSETARVMTGAGAVNKALSINPSVPSNSAPSVNLNTPDAPSLRPALTQGDKKHMSEQTKRVSFGILTKALKVPPRKAVAFLEKHGAEPARYPMPKLGEEIFAVEELEALHPTSAGNLPAYPFSSPRHVLYRGINVSSSDLRNILQNGLRAEDSGKHHSDFQVFNYPSRELMEMYRESCPEANQSICLIADAKRAATYSLRDVAKTERVPIVIQVEHTIPQTANPVQAGVLATENIPVDKIRRISTLLEIDGAPRWGDISMTPEGSFLFQPYVRPN